MPAVPMSSPANAGPAIEETCQPAWLSATAAGTSSSASSRGIAACRAGPWMAARNHVAALAACRSHSGGSPASAPANNTPETPTAASSVQISVTRRSWRSMNAEPTSTPPKLPISPDTPRSPTAAGDPVSA